MSSFSLHEMLRADGGAAAADVSDAAPVVRPAASPRTLSPLAESIARLPVRNSASPSVLAGLVRLLDFALIVGTGLVIYAFYVEEDGLLSSYLTATILTAIVSVVVFEAAHSYHAAALRSVIGQSMRILGCWTLVFLLMSAALFFLKAGSSYSRVWLAAWYGLGFASLLLQRVGVAQIVKALTRAGRLERRAAIVGGGEPAEKLIRAIEAQGERDVKICGVFDDRGDDRSPDVVAAYPKLGTVDELVEFARRTRLDLVVFALPVSAENRILAMLRKLWVLPVDIRLSAHMQKLRFRPRSYSYVGGVPVFDMMDKPIADWDIVLKWSFDKFVGTAMLVLLSPVLLGVAVAVKLDSRGPVFFKQRRYGFNNELIEVFKFRSMYVEQSDATAARLVTKGDARVTRVGRFIRKASLDELPQLFNVVFRGNLSLVGPRPHAVHAKAQDRLYDEVVDGYFARHKVKPGITGWAQVNGWRGETDTSDKIQKRVEHDLYYIENWSIFFDAYILAMTPVSLTRTENAY